MNRIVVAIAALCCRAARWRAKYKEKKMGDYIQQLEFRFVRSSKRVGIA